MSSERAKLVEEVLLGARELSTETVMFHTAIAETRGLSPVESKVLDYLARLGPQMPKELARLSGLAPASVTALIDRLERKGFVSREPHPDDRRKVLIALDPGAIERSMHLWDHLVAKVLELCERYSDDELRTVIGFVAAAAAITHESTVKLTDSPGG
ncbi:MarR family winged helix-turn-helix transcriptional regulator [Amycolatopsis sp. NPDC088138]|uniref:MarR family winged helix-turn-helix transcriptional regulator n=1 Tax=Amycolatopsis sp. NPDC088138 TaxID=3363938 RepID=UPI00382DBF52